MLAKALLAVKPEVVGGMHAVHHAGLQRVGVATGFQALQCGGNQRAGVGIGTQLGTQLLTQRLCARVAAGRQLQVALQLWRGP